MILKSHVSFFIWMDHECIYFCIGPLLIDSVVVRFIHISVILSIEYFLYRILIMWTYCSTVDGYLSSFPFKDTQIAIVTAVHVSQLIYTQL